MGNTKTYYIEGELVPGTTLDKFKSAVSDGFHSTYCVAEIVEEKGGYLGGGKEGGPYIVAAIHSYSIVGDQGPNKLLTLFKYFNMHRVDSDWGDCWIMRYDSASTPLIQQWRAHDSEWVKQEIGK